jgi:hypothetical protein
MSDENEVIDEAIIDDEQQVEQVVEKEQDETIKGFMSKEDWVASGKDVADWRDPIEFRHRGEMIKLRNEMTRERDEQIKNLNLLHNIRLEREREDLLRMRDDAIDIADRAEVKRIDKQLESNYQQAALVKDPVQQAKAPEVAEWEAENPWCLDPTDPRLELANRVCSAELSKGSTLAKALREVDKAVAAKFVSPQKQSAQMVEGSRTAGGKRDAGGVIWAELTSEEKEAWDTGMFNNPKDKDGGKAAFLKTVANGRKGSK